MKRVAIATAAILAAGIWATPVTGQGAAGAPTEQVVRELAGIQRSLGDLVELLDTMRLNQDAGLVLRRIELHERRLAPMAQRLEANKQVSRNDRSIWRTASTTDATRWISSTSYSRSFSTGGPSRPAGRA